MSINASIIQQLLVEVREIRILIREHYVPQPLREIKIPQHADPSWVMQQLGISRTTFYEKVRNILLHPTLRIGNRDYYDRQEVYQLLQRRKEDRFTYKMMSVKAMEERLREEESRASA